MDEILESVCALAQDQYGNYVTQVCSVYSSSFSFYSWGYGCYSQFLIVKISWIWHSNNPMAQWKVDLIRTLHFIYSRLTSKIVLCLKVKGTSNSYSYIEVNNTIWHDGCIWHKRYQVTNKLHQNRKPSIFGSGPPINSFLNLDLLRPHQQNKEFWLFYGLQYLHKNLSTFDFCTKGIFHVF